MLLHLLSAKDLACEQLLIDQICKFWHKALHSWVPQTYYAAVSRWLSRFLLKKAVLTHSTLTKDFCILKLNDFAHDAMTVRLFADCFLKHNCRLVVPVAVLEMSLDEQKEFEGDYDPDETIEVCEMSLHHRYYFAKSLHSSLILSTQEKEAIAARVFRGTSSSAVLYREVSQASLPDPVVKKQVWSQIVETDSSVFESSYMRYRQMTNAFVSGVRVADGSITGTTYEMVEGLLGEYFERLLHMIKNKSFSRQKCVNFMETCFPLNLRPEGSGQ